MSRKNYRANRAASEAANGAAREALLSTPIPADHPSQYEPGYPPVRAPRSRSGRSIHAILGMAMALSGGISIPPVHGKHRR